MSVPGCASIHDASAHPVRRLARSGAGPHGLAGNLHRARRIEDRFGGELAAAPEDSQPDPFSRWVCAAKRRISDFFMQIDKIPRPPMQRLSLMGFVGDLWQFRSVFIRHPKPGALAVWGLVGARSSGSLFNKFRRCTSMNTLGRTEEWTNPGEDKLM